VHGQQDRTQDQGNLFSMLLISRVSSLSFQNIFKSCDFTGTLKQLAGKIQSSPPAVFLALGSILGISQVFVHASFA
jgi:hypothetical protein